MNDNESETSSNISRHCYKTDLYESIEHVRAITKDCRECQRMRDCLKNTIKLNLTGDVYDLVCKFCSCSKCNKIHSVIDECIEYWNFHSLWELQTLFFIRFNSYPSYEFIQSEINKDNNKYTIEMHSKLASLYDKLFNVEFIDDMKYEVCKGDPDELHDYFNILQLIIYHIMDNKKVGGYENYHSLYDYDFGFTILLQLNEDWFRVDSETETEDDDGEI